ncbi:PfkB family carbohydrate kinase [Microlunatus panaciterrae]|uniref:Fructokinase n=1 Tax=Microlunatus panaciterrae TaxID=400768 RepID=A0ABS2RFQ0_9ACTN|nr:carbohydrate kinase [Microlunatus panaciterrae]MBM7797830.1 fructokinase [Microlunatus panaciterrae]
MTRFVVCGETLIDLVKSAEAPRDHFSSTWFALSAGGPMNTAVALGRLGADCHFLGRLSSDDFGVQLRNHIESAGVLLDLATVTDQSTSIAVVTLDADGVASYAFHFADTANFNWRPGELPVLDRADWLHIASLACVVKPGADVLLDWAASVQAPISYDINVRPTVITDPAAYWALVEPWLQVVGRGNGVVKASDEDLKFLARVVSPSATPDELAAQWVEQYDLGLAVVTLGAGGAVAVRRGGESVRVAGFPTSVVDTVGAGDTFMAGFLDGYVSDPADLVGALRRGAAAASIVCSRKGAQPPTTAEVNALLALGQTG